MITSMPRIAVAADDFDGLVDAHSTVTLHLVAQRMASDEIHHDIEVTGRQNSQVSDRDHSWMLDLNARFTLELDAGFQLL